MDFIPLKFILFIDTQVYSIFIYGSLFHLAKSFDTALVVTGSFHSIWQSSDVGLGIAPATDQELVN